MGCTIFGRVNRFVGRKQHRIIFVLLIFIFSTIFYYFSSINNRNNIPIEILVSNDEDFEFNQESVKFRWCPRHIPANPNINCESLFNNKEKYLEKWKKWKNPCPLSDTEMAKLTKICTDFKRNFVFWSHIKERQSKPYTDSEHNDYPLAFVIIGARNADQMVRLFQSIYLQKNIYCITYDNKSSEDFKKTLQNLDKCFDNVLMAKTFVNIHWAGFSILKSTMNCLQVLYEQKRHKWRYVQILSYNDYPLRTNEETIRIMQIFNGSQDSFLAKHAATRSRIYYNVFKKSTTMEKHMDESRVNDTKSIPPGNLIEYKGSLATTMSRDFVEFMFENPISRKFYEWSNTTYMAEEMYFSTLIHNLHIKPPGGFPGSCLSLYDQVYNVEKPYVSRYQIWDFNNLCKGMTKLFSCVYGVGDLPDLKNRPELMAHKVYLEFQPATYYCLSQLHYNRTMRPETYANLDENFYKNLPAVQYHSLSDSDKAQYQC